MSESDSPSPVNLFLWFDRLRRALACLIFPSLCIAALLFPFSVAVSNIAFGTALAASLLSGAWWQGLRICYFHFPRLFICLGIYFIFFMLGGLIWTIDLHWGLHVLGRQWFWLLLPVFVISLAETQKRSRFLLAVSTGLSANLVFCVLQMFDFLVVTTVAGSSANDATGYIGHIGFGVVYGVWAAWLLFLGLQWQGVRRWSIWGLAAWAYVMIFAAQGRNGYVVAVLMAMVVLFKWYQGVSLWRPLAIMCGLLLLISLVLLQGEGKERIYGTWLAMSGQQQISLDQSGGRAQLASNDRQKMRRISIEIWQDNPAIGVGSGGFPAAVASLYQAGNIDVEAFNGNLKSGVGLAHPHNQYLLDLVRWGPGGLLSLMAIFYFWIKMGWKQQWRLSFSGEAALITLSGLALALSGLFEPSMEEHFSGVFAVMLLGCGLAWLYREDPTNNSHDVL